MDEFKVIETQEDFDKAIKKRLEQKDRELSEKFKGWSSPEDVSKLKEDYEKKISEANEALKKANETIKGHDQEVSDLKARVSTAETSLMKGKIANENGIPLELAARLVGDTEEDIRKDAENFASFLSPRTAPPLHSSTPAAGGNGLDAAYATMLATLNNQT